MQCTSLTICSICIICVPLENMRWVKSVIIHGRLHLKNKRRKNVFLIVTENETIGSGDEMAARGWRDVCAFDWGISVRI